MFDLLQHIRPHLLGIKPYSSARDEFKKNAKTNSKTDISADIFLDANENAMGSVAKYFHNRYPDPLQRELKFFLTEKLNSLIIKTFEETNLEDKQNSENFDDKILLKPENVFFGNGSDEPIDLLIRLMCEPSQDNILTCTPTYGMYEVSANIHNVGIKEVPLDNNFQLNLPKIFENLDKNTKIIFLCSPNNPTGNSLNTNDILEILQKTNDENNNENHALVVIDEAYIDFAKDQIFWLKNLQKFKNLVILRTFSKAWGLADIRLGIAFGDELLISFLNKIKPPYNINQHTQEVALNAIKQWHKKDNFVNELLEQRIFLENGLKNSTLVEKIYPSDANFILVKVKDANEMYQYLLKNGIVVRNRTNVKGCENCLRITIGTFAENNEIVERIMNWELEIKN